MGGVDEGRADGGGLPGWRLARGAAAALMAFAALRVFAFYTEVAAVGAGRIGGMARPGAMAWWVAGAFVGVGLSVAAGAAAWRVGEALRRGGRFDDPAVVRTLRRYWMTVAALAAVMLAQSVWGYAAVLVERFL